MPQVVISREETKKSVKTGGNDSGGSASRLPMMIGAGVVALVILAFFLFTHSSKPAGPAFDANKVAPPAGYPDQFPYNSKLWQEGKIPQMGGFPAPPIMGGKPSDVSGASSAPAHP